MSEFITFPKPSGASYIIPDVGDSNWGQNVTDFLVAIPNGTVPTSGTFTLTGDLSWGASFGLLSKYFTSITANPSTAGVLRLAKTDIIGWRNNANSGNNLLTVNSSDVLQYNGASIPTGTIVNSITGTANQVIASSSTGAVTLSLPQSIGITNGPTFGSLTIGNTSSVPGDIVIQSTASVAGHLDFLAKDGSGYAELLAPATATTYGLKLPTAQGGASTCLQNDGAGQLAWSQALGTASNVTFANVVSGLSVPISSNIDFRNSGATQHLFIQGNPVSSFTLQLPQNQGAAGTFIENDGSGNLSFSDVFPQLSADPVSPREGQVWYNTTSHLWKGYNGTSVRTFTTT